METRPTDDDALPLPPRRGRWLHDLALVIADEIRAAPHATATTLLVVLVTYALCGSATQVWVPVVCAFLLAPLWLRGLGPRARGLALSVSGVVAVALAVAFVAFADGVQTWTGSLATTSWEWELPRYSTTLAAAYDTSCLVLLVVMLVAAVVSSLRPRDSARRIIVGFCGLVLGAAVLLHVVPLHAPSAGRSESSARAALAVLLEVGALVGFGAASARRDWHMAVALCAAWLLVLSNVDALAPSSSSGGGHLVLRYAAGLATCGVVCVAARVGRVLAARAEANGEADAADQAAVRLASALRLRPWRAAFLVVGVAALIPQLRAHGEDLAPWGSGATAWMLLAVLPTNFALASFVVIRAQWRGADLLARLPALLAPPTCVLAWFALELLLTVVSIGPAALGQPRPLLLTLIVDAVPASLAPAFAYAACVAIGRARSMPAAAAIALLATTACVTAPWFDALLHALGVARRQWYLVWPAVGWTVAVPAFVVLHTLVTSRARASHVLRLALGWSAATALLANGPALLWEPSVDSFRAGAVHAFVLVGRSAAAVLAVALARRLTSMTVLPADHGVVLWKQAMADHDAATAVVEVRAPQ